MSIIQGIYAREILDSRGVPTVEVDVHVDGLISRVSCPSGASTGSREAVELRDGDKQRFQGKGVLKAINNVVNVIAPALVGKSCLNQREIDSIMMDLDNTHNKSNLGANAIISVSIAVMKAAALYNKMPLFKYINPAAKRMPLPLVNILNGGLHADNKLDIQEFMIAPIGAKSFKDSLRMCSEVFHELKFLIKRKGLVTAVGDEGGFAPDIQHADEAIELILQAIDKAGYNTDTDIKLALDVAASELYEDNHYNFKGESKRFNKNDLVKYYESLVQQYPIFSIEDAMAEQDFDGWKDLTAALGNKVQLVGDDVFVTNTAILEKCIQQKIGNSILIKPNQIGSLSETFDAINLAHSKNYSCVMSHRSGETEDTTIAHLAVGMQCDQIKTGSICRVDRTAKYNELLRIEEALGAQAEYASFKKFSEVLSIF